MQASTVILTLLTFILYPYFRPEGSEAGNIPDAAQTLSGLALINQFTVPLSIIPVIVPDLIAACNSTIRLEEFFRKPEVVGSGHRKCAPTASSANSREEEEAMPLERSPHRPLDNIAEDEEEAEATDDVIVHVAAASFSWPVDDHVTQSDDDVIAASERWVLRDIELKIRRGSLTVVVGHVGSGKSSLLLALLGELDLDGGQVTWARGGEGRGQLKRHNTCGYVAQRPWLMQV